MKFSMNVMKILLGVASIFSVTASPSDADIIYGTSGSNIVSYNTQTQATATISTDLYVQSYGIAYSPTNGDLYVVDRVQGVNQQKIEMYSTSGTDLGPFASGIPYNGFSAGLAFDKSGNLYASSGSTIEEFYAGGGSALLPAPAGGFSIPNQLTVDSSGDLFVADLGNNNIYEYGPSHTTPTLSAHLSAGVEGVTTDSAGNVYVSTGGSNIYEYNSSGSLVGNPFSNRGAYGLVYSPGTNSIFGAGPPLVIQYNVTNGNPSTNWSQVSNTFNGTEYLTVESTLVPEPTSGVLLSLGALGLLWASRAKRRVLRA